MNDEQHKQLIDYIFKVFKQDNKHLDILNKRTLTFEEAFKLMQAYAKDHRGWSWSV